jgi:hypothetical protein
VNADWKNGGRDPSLHASADENNIRDVTKNLEAMQRENFSIAEVRIIGINTIFLNRANLQKNTLFGPVTQQLPYS